ncbi:hypothetical protein F5878DRAFT_369433 [Lentinula raphanica]|uniref:GATA-type domain-containing protein n=1 Tax=Lentinula raphanica TaxID=153919 RepID=A0AA38P145_9AGAR|nr:hypothetical protein F5878DRAFT_369433 [Lentinula raphanica]
MYIGPPGISQSLSFSLSPSSTTELCLALRQVYLRSSELTPTMSVAGNGNPPPGLPGMAWKEHPNVIPILYSPFTSTPTSEHVRRVCSHCTTIITCEWRRTTLSPGLWRCDRCGSYEKRTNRPHPNPVPEYTEPRAIEALRERGLYHD